MKIYYGIETLLIDVTDVCLSKLKKDNILTIPDGDLNRANYFSDPLYGVHKLIFIEKYGVVTEYDEYERIKINTITDEITTELLIKKSESEVTSLVLNLHSKLKLKHGSFNDELPEQKMAVRYLTGNEKVLEIGGNIGRNSLIIASILNNANNLVTLESDVNIARQLIENRDLNNFNFHTESSALSNRKLIQKGWDTIPSDSLIHGYDWVNTITFADLKKKYNIDFDTLILDCEGAFYYILMDMPEILNNVNLIIMENDYWDRDHKNYVDSVLIKNGFYRDYVESGGWGPCYNIFYEAWKK